MFSKIVDATMRTLLALATPSFALVATQARAGFLTFSVGGTTATSSIQSTVDSFRAALGDPNNGNNPGPLANGRREMNWDGGDPNITDTTAPVTPFDVFLNPH